MRFRHFHSLRPSGFRRIVAGVALLAYVVTVGGFPLPAPVVSSEHGEKFICQDHACGCRSAAQCWNNCCCFTPAERLAWADAHEVRLPGKLRQALVAQASQPERNVAAACCATAAPDSHDCCDAHEHESHQHTCSNDVAGRHDCGHCSTTRDAGDSHQHANDAPRVRWTLGIEALKCQGLSTLWVVSGACLPLEVPTLWQFDWTTAGAVSIRPSTPLAVLSAPPVPPPQA